ncbi:hypothetical protein KDM41_09895 [bacterium]|nr:hypothetical protein [bacterium]
MTAATLKDAYRIVRQDYGEDAVILGTRTVNQRQELGLGHERRIEVTVQLPGDETTNPAPAAARPRATRSLAARGATARPDASGEILAEVARIEELVAAIAADHARLTRHVRPHCDNRVAETLMENGASPEAVETLLTRFVSETGLDPHDRPAAVTWLADSVQASNCTWDDFYGCHAFLGDAGSGRTDLVLTAAGLLQQRGRRTLVLSLMPPHGGDVRRLQGEAATGGFDAAVIRKAGQLAELEDHLAGYDVVLVDMPALGSAEMDESGPVHAWLARNATFHRHLLVPLDRDPRDMAGLRAAARTWNCDWIVLSRTDMTTRPAKMLDVLASVPVPVSLVGARPRSGGDGLEIAQSETLLDAMLAASVTAGPVADGSDTFEAGVPAVGAALEVAW